MSDLIPKNTDEEMERYMEADMIRRARIPMEGNQALKFEHDSVTKRENALFPLSSGGYVKIGDRAVTPEQAAETDVLAAEREIQNDARGPIGDVIGGAGGPTMEDYEAAGFTEAEVVQFQAQEQARVLSQPGIEVPVQLTEEQMQFGEDVGAPMLTATPGSAGAPLDFEMPPSGALERLAVAIGKGLVEGTVVSPLQFVLDTFGVQEPQIVQDLDQALQLDEDASVLLEQLPKGIAQFFGPFAAVGKLLRLGRGFLPTMGQAAAADFLGFEGNEGRLTDVLLEFGLPPNAITEMLRTDPNDPEYIGRIKNAAEGALLGIPIEAVARVVGALRSGSAKELEGSLSEMQQGAQLSFRQRINNLTSDFVGAARATGRMDPDMMREIFQRGGQPRSLGAAGTGVDDAALVENTQEYLNQIGVQTPPSLGGLPGRISTRLPTAARATEDPMTGELIIGYDELRADPKVFEPNVNIVRDYPNMRPQPDATTDETAEQFITHVKDNLLYLHDQVPEATRTRSQLWYDGARNITDRWSQEYGVADTGIAGALAALSPQKDWYQNVSLAERVLNVTRPTSGTPTQFTPEMQETFRRIDSLNKPKYEPLLDAIRGKSYDEITDPDPAVQNALRALFVRLHDQTYSSPDYRIVGPEGDFLDVATNADGSPSRVGWGSLNEIGKAIGSIEANGVVSTISRLMGERHKVRNFYNNIYDPNSPYGDVTIDTHAVAAGLLRPLSGNSLEVDHNFKNTSVPGRGTTKGSAISGVSGNYGLYAEAYRRAAEERGILPRQMQSITWEAVRGLFPDTFKTEANANMIDAIWNRYRSGEIEIDEARRMVNEAAGGINPPTWQQ
jgi:hypothetical protein